MSRQPPGRHRDPFAGALRYHLGLRTPNHPKCWIMVDGVRRSWADGEALVFDETFVHEAWNGTEVTRLILLCDIERPLAGPMRAINRWVMRHVMGATGSPNEAGERVGAINRLYARLAGVQKAIKALKAKNRRLYETQKWATILGLLGLLLAPYLAAALALGSRLMQVRLAEGAELEAARARLVAEWGEPILMRGRAWRLAACDCLIAGGPAEHFAEEFAGLLAFSRDEAPIAEVVALNAFVSGQGVGTALLAALPAHLGPGFTQLRLGTTNDNLDALRFYQRRGWRLAALRPGAVDRARATKPSIPLVGEHGLPIRDEIDLVLDL
jgi:GNAT superfamily N-acetyltransferase